MTFSFTKLARLSSAVVLAVTLLVGIASASVTSTWPTGGHLGDADFGDSNTELVGYSGETWANADGQIVANFPDESHSAHGGEYVERSWHGEIEATHPQWRITLGAKAFVEAIAVSWISPELDCSARSELTLTGSWSHWNGREVETYYPTDWYGTYDIEISVGLMQVTVPRGGQRYVAGQYPNKGGGGTFCIFSFQDRSSQNIVDFTYRTVSIGHVHMEFSSTSGRDIAKFKVDQYGEEEWNGLLTSWDGATPIDFQPLS